jgi:hypothetical protein|tara:strand:- start:312 stop:461 length:150 start_codon:yes stop_codon:yes gene_type:complete
MSDQITVADLKLIIGDQQIQIVSLKSQVLKLERSLVDNDDLREVLAQKE